MPRLITFLLVVLFTGVGLAHAADDEPEGSYDEGTEVPPEEPTAEASTEEELPGATGKLTDLRPRTFHPSLRASVSAVAAGFHINMGGMALGFATIPTWFCCGAVGVTFIISWPSIQAAGATTSVLGLFSLRKAMRERGLAARMPLGAMALGAHVVALSSYVVALLAATGAIPYEVTQAAFDGAFPAAVIFIAIGVGFDTLCVSLGLGQLGLFKKELLGASGQSRGPSASPASRAAARVRVLPVLGPTGLGVVGVF